MPDSAAQRVVLAEDQFDFWIRMLRDAVRTRSMSGLPLSHGYIKCYRDTIRHMEKRQARNA